MCRSWLTCFVYAIASASMYKVLFLYFILLPLTSVGQSNKLNRPIAKFQADSIKIGAAVNFSFYAQHPAATEVIFPDSSYNFAPFELIARRFFTTRTEAGVSLDSVVYTLRTFSVAARQSLSLPVYILENNDTLQLYSQPDEIKLIQLVKGKPDPENLKSHTELAIIKERFNLAYWLIGAGIVIITLLTVWLLFGKNIIIRYRLYTLQKRHTVFINRFNAYIDQFNKSESLPTIEQAITLWKNYLTTLEGNAINSYTTREIASFYNDDEDVTTALRLFDKAIYGNIVSDKSSETIIAFFLLHHFADRRYEVIKDQTRHVTSPENIPQLV